jgi:hypothetical protein
MGVESCEGLVSVELCEYYLNSQSVSWNKFDGVHFPMTEEGRGVTFGRHVKHI